MTVECAQIVLQNRTDEMSTNLLKLSKLAIASIETFSVKMSLYVSNAFDTDDRLQMSTVWDLHW